MFSIFSPCAFFVRVSLAIDDAMTFACSANLVLQYINYICTQWHKSEECKGRDLGVVQVCESCVNSHKYPNAIAVIPIII